jgi:hypothetical protein
MDTFGKLDAVELSPIRLVPSHIEPKVNTKNEPQEEFFFGHIVPFTEIIKTKSYSADKNELIIFTLLGTHLIPSELSNGDLSHVRFGFDTGYSLLDASMPTQNFFDFINHCTKIYPEELGLHIQNLQRHIPIDINSPLHKAMSKHRAEWLANKDWKINTTQFSKVISHGMPVKLAKLTTDYEEYLRSHDLSRDDDGIAAKKFIEDIIMTFGENTLLLLDAEWTELCDALSQITCFVSVKVFISQGCKIHTY